MTNLISMCQPKKLHEIELSFRVQFMTSAKDQRFTKAVVDVAFRDENAYAGDGPWVVGVSPIGKWAIKPTQKHVEMKRSVNASGQAGFVPGSLSLGMAFERTISQDEEDQIIINGMKLFDGRPVGQKRQVRWTLLENKTQKSGIPSQLRTLILVQRKNNAKFTAVVEIETRVDFKSSILRMLGKKPQDEPIIFEPNPEVPRSRKLKWAKEHLVDADNLEAVDLNDLVLIVDQVNKQS